jgi:hypothetical protein
MRKLLLPLLFLSAVISTGCKEKKKISDPVVDKKIEEKLKDNPPQKSATAQYEISSPEGWEKTEKETMGIQTIMLMSPTEGASDRFRENVNVNTEKVGSMSLTDYVTLSEKNMAGVLTAYSKGESGEMMIDGEQGAWFDYKHTYAGTPLDARVYVVIKNNNAYVITATAARNKMSKIDTELEGIIKSFHVN